MSIKYGRMFSLVVDTNSSAPMDLFELKVPSDEIVIVHSLYITQDNQEKDSSDIAFSIIIHRATASGSGGAFGTARRLQLGGISWSSANAEIRNTTLATEGDIVHAQSWNGRQGFLYRPTPKERIVVSPSTSLVVTMQGTGGTNVGFVATLIFMVSS